MVEFLARRMKTADGGKEAPAGVRIGRIAAIHKDGLPMVDFNENPLGPLPARSIVSISHRHLGSQILIIFENDDLSCPIIVGIFQQPPVVVDHVDAPELNRKEITDVIVDGEKLFLKAKKEIEIRCGKSALILKADGKVVIKGEQIISRARKVNKIKGAAVKIN
jgi:hypothetical protein